MSLTALMLTSCISLYTTGGNNSYYSDGIYYTPSQTSRSVVVANAPQQPYYEEPAVIISSNPRVIEGYWMGGWDGSNADLERAYTIIQNYPNGFGYMAGSVNVAESMAFSSLWNVFVSNGRYWWFPTTSNIEFYTDFLFGPYPSSNIVMYDYTPYNTKLRVSVSFSLYGPSFYDPWYYNPWHHHSVWYYDPWYYDPWHHHHYGPVYHPHHGPTYRPAHGPKPGYYPYGPGNRRPDDRYNKPGAPKPGTPGKPGTPNKPGKPGTPSNNRPNQGQWRPTTTPSGNQTITPGTAQRPSVGGGVVGGNGAPQGNNNNNTIVRPKPTNDKTTGSRVEGNKVIRAPETTTKATNTTNNKTVLRPTNTTTNRTTKPTGGTVQNRSVSRPTGGSISRPTGGSISRPTGGSISRPTGGGASRSVGGGGGKISRTR